MVYHVHVYISSIKMMMVGVPVYMFNKTFVLSVAWHSFDNYFNILDKILHRKMEMCLVWEHFK